MTFIGLICLNWIVFRSCLGLGLPDSHALGASPAADRSSISYTRRIHNRGSAATEHFVEVYGSAIGKLIVDTAQLPLDRNCSPRW
jgi:hypothetical protein